MLDGRQQMGEMGRLLRWSLADNGTGRVWRFGALCEHYLYSLSPT